MDSANHLKYLLQAQLATDASAVRCLPYCLSTLTVECFLPSSHLTKWTTRILALLHSKDPGARWAGLCLAYKSSILSQKIMIDSAQSWISVVLPMLSRSEPIPTLNASIRLLRVIFTNARELSEFHRQVCTPNVVKFSHAVLAVSEEQTDTEVKVLCIETLECVVLAYPTTHRASSSALSSFTLRHLNGKSDGPTERRLLEAASRLYGIVLLTGGKVGAVNLWRKALEETLAFGWVAFYSLRTTFPLPGQNVTRPILVDEPQLAIPLNQDRLHCSVVTLSNLFRSPVQRPVQLPLGNLIKFITSLISCSADGAIDGFIDPLVRSMEVSIVPEVWTMGCELLESLVEQFSCRLDPHVGTLLSILVTRLEEKPDERRRLCILKAIYSILKNSHIPDSNVLPMRIAKAALFSVTQIFTPSFGKANDEPKSSSSKGKRRSRNFEGDKIFKTTAQAVYSSNAESDAFLISFDVLQSVYKHPNLSSSMQSIIARMVMSILVSLPKMPSSSLSRDANFISVLNTKVQQFSFTIASGTTNVISKTLPFLIEAVLANRQPEMQRTIAMLLHPRAPPLVRTMPHIESLSLFQSEESQEEKEALSSLGIADLHLHSTEQDVVIGNLSVSGKISDLTVTSPASSKRRDLEEDCTGIIGTDVPQQPPPENSLNPLHAGDVQTKGEQPLPIPPQGSGAVESVLTSQKPILWSSFDRFPIQVEGVGEDEYEDMPPIDMASDTEDEE